MLTASAVSAEPLVSQFRARVYSDVYPSVSLCSSEAAAASIARCTERRPSCEWRPSSGPRRPGGEINMTAGRREGRADAYGAAAKYARAGRTLARKMVVSVGLSQS